MSQDLQALFHHDIDVRDAVQFFLAEDASRDDPDVTPMKLQKLLYLAQANYLASTGRRLFSEPMDAYFHGPVVYRVTKMYSGRQIIAATSNGAALTTPDLPEDVDTFLGRVWQQYKDWTPAALRQLSHDQAPWQDNYVEGEYRCNIPDEDMTEYFRSRVPAKSRVFHDNLVMLPAGTLAELEEHEDEIADRMAQFFDA
ncbi:Panacea domain-containing protein [Curtobacterium sp. MCLR17_039]|uniref:Panacea domain-containing protein n=1 Tax=Curtobacterium sp. MCLR17_039 TaxID=2175624 RepID=UPI0011B729F0|nr:type II toxin-antitoxin system antitoxin SocA domain-containing protein [Curtobacterium sp. MCLR17_039]